MCRRDIWAKIKFIDVADERVKVKRNVSAQGLNRIYIVTIVDVYLKSNNVSVFPPFLGFSLMFLFVP